MKAWGATAVSCQQAGPTPPLRCPLGPDRRDEGWCSGEAAFCGRHRGTDRAPPPLAGQSDRGALQLDETGLMSAVEGRDVCGAGTTGVCCGSRQRRGGDVV